MAVAISQTISHSCLPLFGFITARTRLIRRSALVKVPSFSRNDAPGRNTWANFAVSLRNRSWTTTSSIAPSAAKTCLTFGSDCAMSSPWTNSPRNVPSIAASNMFGMRSPGSARQRCAPQVFEHVAHRVVRHVPVAAAARAGTNPCRRSPARCSGRAAGSRRRRRGRCCRTPSPGSPCPSPSSSPGCARSRPGRSRWHRSAPARTAARRRAAPRRARR